MLTRDKNETEIVRERFADMILRNKSRDFWSEVLRMKSSETAVLVLQLMA